MGVRSAVTTYFNKERKRRDEWNVRFLTPGEEKLPPVFKVRACEDCGTTRGTLTTKSGKVRCTPCLMKVQNAIVSARTRKQKRLDEEAVKKVNERRIQGVQVITDEMSATPLPPDIG